MVSRRLITHTLPLATPSYPYLPLPLPLPTLLLLPSTPTGCVRAEHIVSGISWIDNPTYPPTPNQAGEVDLARYRSRTRLVRGVLEACVLDVLSCGVRCVLLRSPKHGTRHRRLRAALAHLTRQVLRFCEWARTPLLNNPAPHPTHPTLVSSLLTFTPTLTNPKKRLTLTLT